MFALVALTAFAQSQTTTITEALAIGGVSKAGRLPFPNDAIVDQVVSGQWHAPAAGDSVTFGGSPHAWRAVKADKDGWMESSGYIYVHVDSPSDKIELMRAQGDSVVYVNGSLRAGDPYSTGNLQLPIELHQGSNDLLFAVGRGRLKVELSPMTPAIQLQSSDVTLPDILTTDRGTLLGSVIALNGTGKPVRLHAVATLPDGTQQEGPATSVMAASARKIPFEIPVPKSPKPGPVAVTVELWNGGEKLDTKTLTVNVKNPLDHYNRTFMSQIDGSVQYYAVDPAAKPSKQNALVLTVHGAGVEAAGQAAAYSQKDWATVVAATNRRPYGFDWEDIGREDALEVLGQAEKSFPHDPARVDLTGHSMGGHGTWSIGTLYPGTFASIAPSAGWISFWSYAGGWSPSSDSDTEKLVRRSMNVSDTLGRVTNTLAEKVYILHGDADDNVPVEQARTMKAALEKIGHPALQYHEQPGAGHWWGNQCVDWRPIFQMIQDARIDPNPATIDFTTQNPAVSPNEAWVHVIGQVRCLEPSRVQAKRNDDGSILLTTTNVASLALFPVKAGTSVTIDGQTLAEPKASERGFELVDGHWQAAEKSSTDGARMKSGVLGGPFKNVFNDRFMFVVGTKGTAEEKRWALDRARFDAETMLYRGNGSINVVLDREFDARRFAGCNVILYGNADTNLAWKKLLADCPVQVREGEVTATHSLTSGEVGGLIVYPMGNDRLVGAVTGSGIEGMRLTDRLALFTSGVAYPDWTLFKQDQPGGILGDGFFDNHWKLDPSQSAWASK